MMILKASLDLGNNMRNLPDLYFYCSLCAVASIVINIRLTVCIVCFSSMRPCLEVNIAKKFAQTNKYRENYKLGVE